MMERRIGIWAAILFLVIASRGCYGGYLQEFEELVRSDLRKASVRRWREDSQSSYSISLGPSKLAAISVSRTTFQDDLSKLDDLLKGEMVNAEVLFSSNECLVVVVEATTPHVNFLYQLSLDGDATSPKVKRAFILGGWDRRLAQHEIHQHKDIFERLKDTIKQRTTDILLDIFIPDALPLLVLQVLDGKSCKTYAEESSSYAADIYNDEFLFLFEESDRLEVKTTFEGGEYIQFTGDIISGTSGLPIYKLWMAATVVRKGSDKVSYLYIVVKKVVAEDLRNTAADQLSAGASQIDESP